MNSKLQFRVLYRQFLFRMMDVELLSASAAGDASGLLGQLGALLISPSVIFALGAFTVGQAVRNHDPMAFPGTSVELFLISTTMLVVGVFALLGWDSIFPDRRDVLVLAPLPVRGRTLFAAKMAAAAAALGLLVAAWNSFSATAWAIMLAPGASGLTGVVRYEAAIWVAVAAAGAFIYCLVLGIQGAAAQLPRRWYLRISSALQIAAFILFLAVFCFQPSLLNPQALTAPENQRTLQWLPTYWFLGLLEALGGGDLRAVASPLAWRALAGVAIAIVVAGGAFLLSYLRTLRKIVEEPDVTPGARGGIWLPPFGTLPQTALAQFAIRTLARSRQQRVILGFYLGAGLAIVSVYLEGLMEMTHFKWADILRLAGTPMMVASSVMLCASWLGTRTVFAMPIDLRANWLFRVTPVPPAAQSLAATRRALLALAVVPILAASAALLFVYWPWRPAAEHLLVLALAGSILTDLSLREFRKIPFACSYLPGKSKVHLVFWFAIVPAIMLLHKAAELEHHAMATPVGYGVMIALLAAVALAARRLGTRGIDEPGAEIQFEEIPSDAPVTLGLNR
jgi:hypothetical protein